VRLVGRTVGALAAALLAGCSAASVPSQSHPICSWAVQVPSNSDALCAAAFRTLSRLAAADARGDDRTVRRLVSNRSIADQIIAYGRQLRSQGLRDLHIVPSLTLDLTPAGMWGAEFVLAGKTSQGNFHQTSTLYFRSRRGVDIVEAQDPLQAW
jgi:hypothetical protein